ncbi:hypothetical protein MOQ72_40675 [Saccharopolyspora sp. K220]|nr:hypothetical protein [Saccharopolyspora soli]MCI2423740.1 hypothetical protein [Saccharopolyspora soli]
MTITKLRLCWDAPRRARPRDGEGLSLREVADWLVIGTGKKRGELPRP